MVTLEHISPFSASKLGLAQRWFRSRSRMLYFDHCEFSPYAREKMEADPRAFMLIMDQQPAFIGFVHYVDADKEPVIAARVEFDPMGWNRKITFLTEEESPREAYIVPHTRQLPGYPYGLDKFLDVMQRFEAVQRTFLRQVKGNRMVIFDGYNVDGQPEQSLLRVGIGRVWEEAHIIPTDVLYSTEPYSFYKLLVALHEKGLLKGITKAIDLGCGFGLVTLMLSIFVKESEGIDSNPNFMAALNETGDAPLSGCGRISFRNGDLMQENLSPYDLIYLFSYWDRGRRERMRTRIKEQTKPGSLVIESLPIKERKSLFHSRWAWRGKRTKTILATDFQGQNFRAHKVIV